MNMVSGNSPEATTRSKNGNSRRALTCSKKWTQVKIRTTTPIGTTIDMRFFDGFAEDNLNVFLKALFVPNQPVLALQVSDVAAVDPGHGARQQFHFDLL